MDVVKFIDVRSTDLTAVERYGNDLVLRYGTTDGVTVTDYFNPDTRASQVEQIEFSDGVTWDEAAIAANVTIVSGSSGAAMPGAEMGLLSLVPTDVDLPGTEGEDLLLGTSQNEHIIGLGGDDIFLGGGGNDLLDGRSGDDTYVFNLGDGVDTIRDLASPGAGNSVEFGIGITTADLTLCVDDYAAGHPGWLDWRYAAPGGIQSGRSVQHHDGGDVPLCGRDRAKCRGPAGPGLCV